jgi:hypothetical protein
VPFLDSHPDLCSLLDDPRIHGPASRGPWSHPDAAQHILYGGSLIVSDMEIWKMLRNRRLSSPAAIGLAAGLLGEDFNLMGSDGNYYAGDTQWHSDGGHAPDDPMHIKIAFYLDTLTAKTGALRLIPGSHKLGDAYATALGEVTSAAKVQEALGFASGAEVPAVAIGIGRIVASYYLLMHCIPKTLIYWVLIFLKRQCD